MNGLIAADLNSRVPLGAMAERVKVTDAVRSTGVPGDVIFLAIRRGEISSSQDDKGYDWVDPDEVAALTVPR